MRIIDAAKYIIHLSYSVKSRSLTLGKLQAVLYLSQGWSYVWDNAPLLLKYQRNTDAFLLL